MPHGNSLPWFFPLQPVSSCRSGQLWHLVPLQLPHLPHHAGGQLVLDALVVSGLQVSPRALPARQRLSSSKVTAQAPEGTPRGTEGTGWRVRNRLFWML